MKKVLYITSPCFFDYDLGLINEMRKKVDLYVLIDISPVSKNSTVISIEDYDNTAGLYPCTKYKEFSDVGSLIDLDKTYLLHRNTSGMSLANLKIQFSLRRLMKEKNIELIHFNRAFSPDYLLSVVANSGIRIVQTFHDPVPHIDDRTLRRSLIDKTGKFFADRFVIFNQNQYEEFSQTISKSKRDRILISNLGVYTFLPGLRGTDLAHITGNKPYILFFGRFSKYKGIDVLLKAFEKVHSKEVRLILAGSGPFEGEISDPERVILLNRYITNEELTSLISHSLFVVCPYIEATQSGVVMTTYGFSKTIVASNVGGLTEYVPDHKTGLLTEPGNPDDLAQKMNELIDNPQLRITLENNIKSLCEDGVFAYNHIVSKLIDFYDK